MNVPLPLPLESVATLLNEPAPAGFAHNSTLASPEAFAPGSEALYETEIEVDAVYAGELAFDSGAPVSSSVVVSAPVGATSRFPALSTAIV